MSAILTTVANTTANKQRRYHAPKAYVLAALTLTLALTAGCQSLPNANTSANTNLQPTPTLDTQKLSTFNITGKIGVTIPASLDINAERTGGSAFYAWGQENERFAIELIGALGIGKTNIEYNGTTATLVSEKTGTLTADDPETLLQKATGWQAPISQLPYWISGRAAPSDNASKRDAQNRLISTANGDWIASFSYQGRETLPQKISATQPTGQKVVMTITHSKN